MAFEAGVQARPDGADEGVVYASGGLLHLLTAPHLFGGDLSKAGMEAGGPSIDHFGNAAFYGELPLTQVPAPGVADFHDYAVLVGGPGGVQVVAREGDRAPGTPEGVVFTGFYHPEDGHPELDSGFKSYHVAGHKQLSLVATLAGPGVPRNQQAAYGGTPGDLKLVARSGDPAPGGGTFQNYMALTNNAAGQLLLLDSGDSGQSLPGPPAACGSSPAAAAPSPVPRPASSSSSSATGASTSPATSPSGRC